MAAVVVPPELWAEFDNELDALIEGTKSAEESYTVGKGMSLASIAVGSAAMRLSKVRVMAQGRDLQGTKAALKKAALKVREAAFASSGDPEGVTLGENLDVLAALMDVLGRMENPAASGRDAKPASRDDAKARAAATAAVAKKRKEKSSDGGEQPENTHEEASGIPGREGLFHDLGIVEPDDDPLSCLADEENDVGGRPKMRFLVEQVDPKLAENERKLYWGYTGNFSSSNKWDCLAPRTSLIGEGRQHARVLQETLLQISKPITIDQVSKPTIDEKVNTKEQQPSIILSSVASTTAQEPATASPTSSFFKGAKKKETLTAQEHPKPEEPSKIITSVKPEALQGDEGEQATTRPDLDMMETLRKQVRQASKDDYWPRLSLAYTLEEQGEFFSTAGNFPASCSAYSEASELFRSCSIQMPKEPEALLRAWVTAQRAREAGRTRGPPDIELLRRCIKICNGGKESNSKGARKKTADQDGPNSCESPVCYEAHMELVSALLERGQFERCAEACRHILGKHDADDAEASYSLAQALVALGRSEEASKWAKPAGGTLLAEAS